MGKDILSLKSLYRFLFDCDYPVFSMGIVEKKYHVGLTVTKFWQEKILPEFRNTKSGRVIWRAEGGRNKYTSEILNRTGARSIYVKYAEELVYTTNQSLAFRQIEVFKDFLISCNYNYKVFMTKLSAYLELLAKEDEMFTADVQDFFQDAMAQRKKVEEHGAVEQAFLCGWFLTFLMLYSFAGTEEGYGYIRQLSHDKRLAPDNLVATYFEKEYAQRKSDKYLTEQDSELCSVPLERRYYFGREEAFFELHQMLQKGGKYLISGIGGVGKTELMRQFLTDCRNEDLVDYICVIQYENNFEDSLVKAFSKARGKNKEENLTEALATIRIHENDRIIIVVDNVDHSVEEDKGLKLLLELPGTVFVTSRYQALQGFETYCLESVEKRAGALIFRDNYQLPMQTEDRQVLEELLQKDAWRHPLTIRLLSKVATTKEWSLQEIMQLLNKGEKVLVDEDAPEQDELGKLYSQMYAVTGFTKDWNTFLRVFARLPYNGYRVEFAERYMQTFITDDSSMSDMLELFWRCGWLEKRGDEYSMQPFIAESLSAEPLSLQELQPFFDGIIEAWLQAYDEGPDLCLEEIYFGTDIGWNGQLQELTIIVGRMLRDFAEGLENKYLQLLLMSMYLERSMYGMVQGHKEILMHLKECANQFNDNVRGFIYALCAGSVAEDELQMLYTEVENTPGIENSIRNIFVLQYLEEMEKIGKMDGLEDIISVHQNPENSVSVTIQYTLHRASIYYAAGQVEPYEGLSLQALELGYANGMARTRLLGEIRDALICLYVSVGRYDEAERLLEDQEKYLKGKETLYFHWSKLYCRGCLKLFRGDPEFGVSELEEAKRVGMVVAASGENLRINEMALYSELAIAYEKVGRREEAEECYLKVLNCWKSRPSYVMQLYRTYNNMGVMYLNWEKDSQAEECFREAYEGGKPIGGLALAEPANNLSKIARKQGNREKELEYLEMALPILEKYYGSEHPKVIDAKKRKNEG